MPYLQAFEDVNKRVFRLSANIPPVRNNLCPLSLVDVEPRDYLRGLIAVYELNGTEYLDDVFVWAYTRSCERYATVHQPLGEPDPFRLTDHQEISDLVREIARSGMDRVAAVATVQTGAH